MLTNLYRAFGSDGSEMEELCKSAICGPLLAIENVKAFPTGNVSVAPGGYDDAEEIKTLDARGYRLLVARALEGVESERTKRLIATRLESLDPTKAVNKSKQVTLDSAISTDRKLADELRLRRTEVACQAMCEGGNAAVVAKAMIYNGRLFNLSNGGLELITSLRSKECQGTRGLGAEYLRRLDFEERRIKNRPGQGAKEDKEAERKKDAEQKPLQCKRADLKDEDYPDND